MSTLPDGKSAPADLQFQIDTLLHCCPVNERE